MYYIVAFISIVVRQVYLPNPYEAFFEPGIATLFNVVIGSAILHILSFTITGIYYNRGESPALGSASYLFWYCINTAIITAVGTNVSDIYLSLATLLVIYIVIYSWLFKNTNSY